MFYQLVKSKIKNKTERRFKRGEIIYNEGDLPRYLYFIESGMVGLFYVSESGKETFFRVFGKNDILGHRSYFAEEPYHGSSIALAPTTLVMISKEECDRMCEQEPALLRQVTALMAKDLGQAELRLAGLLDKTAARRISESLVFLKLKYPEQVWTRKEIAEYSGSTYETVTRVMTDLEKKGLITKKGRDFSIHKPELLLSLDEDQL